MKNIISLFFVIILLGFAAESNAQETYATDSIFYYYKGVKQHLPLNTKNVVVYYNALDTLEVNNVFDSMRVVEDVMCEEISFPNQKRLLINIEQKNYDRSVRALQNIVNVVDVEPVIGIDKLKKVSRRFYVKLKNRNDYSKLDSLSILNRVTILGEVPSCENWYELEVSKISTGNAITISNLYWETGLFADIDPGFLFDFQNNFEYCVTDSSFNEQWGPQQIHACEAWHLTTGTSSVKVAVIDQGVDVQHRELNHVNVYFSYDEITNSVPAQLYYSTVYPGQNIYHGTHVGGIIFSNHNANQVSGISPNVSLINLSHNLIADNDDQIAKLATAISHAVQQGAHVINNSWGDQGGTIQNLHSPLIEQYIDMAINNNCLVVFAAGNHSPSMDYPATYRDEILTVGSIDQYYMKSDFSAYGTHLDIVAPGSSIYSTNHNNTYLTLNGTSMAAPHVSGVAALMLSVNPNLTALNLSNIIEQTTEKVGSYSYNPSSTHPNGTWNQEMGYGLVDAHKAVVYAMEYGYDMAILGDSTLSDCDIKTYTCDILHPELFTYVWSVTPNLSIINDNDCSVNIAPVSTGIGTVTVDVYQQERLMYTLTKSVNVTSIWSVITPVSTVPFHVSSNTTWSSKLSLPVPVTIDSLATLTIADTLFCTPAARIIVRPGGKLIVDGGTLTSACQGGMWQGVYVEGHRDQPQTAANQGTVQFLNGAVVENAFRGIRTSAPGSGWNTTGGIITADSATFRNCAKAVEYLSYAGTNYAGQVMDNKGAFTNCTFTVDDNNLFAANGTDLLAHVSLWDVKGVEFTNCRFEDARTGNHSRKSAISALDAGFEMKTGCSYNVPRPECDCPPASSTHSSFAGFGTAIDAGTSGSPYGIVIDGAQFSDNITGVRIEGSSHATVTRCQFDLSDMPVRVVTGLNLDTCTGYLVEGNTFTRGASAPNGSRYGIRVGNSGTDANGLYRNTFERLSHGIYVTGTNGDDNSNTGLQMTCNGFTSNTYDIYVASGATMGPSQGDNSKGADNTFSGTQTSSLYNAGSLGINYYYSTGTNHALQNPVGNVTLHTNAGSNDCASTLCVLDPSIPGPGPKSPTPSFLALKQQYENLMADFNRNGYADILSTAIPPQSGGTPNVNQETIEAAQYASQQINSIASELFAQSHERIRALMADTLEDLQAVMAWLDATPGLASRYLEAETEFKLGGNNISLADIANHIATQEERDEYDNYLMFSTLKDALRYGNGHVAWINATDAQIGELIRIADANTGRSSLLAKNVLCFFFGICYDDMETRALETTTIPPTAEPPTLTESRMKAESPITGQQIITVHPNPTNDILNVTVTDGDAKIARVEMFDMFGRNISVKTHGRASLPSPQTTVNTSDIPSGLYVLRVTLTDGTVQNIKVARK